MSNATHNTLVATAETFKAAYLKACVNHDMDNARYWLRQYNAVRPITAHEDACFRTQSVHSHNV